MAETTSFQFRYPLNRNPYVADQTVPLIYPWAQWGDYSTSSNLYVYGRQVPFRSYFPTDVNLSARPVSRIIQPTVIEYAPIAAPVNAQPPATQVPVTVTPLLENRFAALNGGNQPLVKADYAYATSLPATMGAQATSADAPLTAAERNASLLIGALLIAGLVFLVVKRVRK